MSANTEDLQREEAFIKEILLVKSGSELATLTGMDANEGVIVSVYPEKVLSGELGDEFVYEQGVQGFPVFADLGPWGKRLIDIVTEPAVAVKWWKVRDYAREHGVNLVPERWQGAVTEIPEQYFTNDYVLGIRLYNEGPWFWPKELNLGNAELLPSDVEGEPDRGTHPQVVSSDGGEGAESAPPGGFRGDSEGSSIVGARTITGGGADDTESTLVRFLRNRRRG